MAVRRIIRRRSEIERLLPREPKNTLSTVLKELAASEDARARATYGVTKSRTIQRTCAQAQRKAESQLRACQNMVHAKDKELTEALAKLSKARDLLASLGIPGYADPKDPAET
ncbi:hypothetical protein Fot_42015 [Forsythia ovata]|uniref:Uncharacterized protein n=1 Tax=Forsythia ovata TaxID=205694 RepID=A0ABD1RLS3_9LAMI